MRKIRLIASDLDGTLLRNNKEISPNTREALKEAAQAGHSVCAGHGAFFEIHSGGDPAASGDGICADFQWGGHLFQKRTKENL